MSKISVVMPVLNGEKYLKESIQSILDQSERDFEFIIINDGSTDNTESIIKSFNDTRIVYIQNETNLGLSKSFNIGIRAAQGEFIARMDADDIAYKHRFKKQLEYLNAHMSVGIVGSAAKIIDVNGSYLTSLYRPSQHLGIKWQSLFSTPLIHPTVMARAKIFKENPYDENLSNSEDYELWSRLIFNTRIKFGNVCEALLSYRTFNNSTTQKWAENKKINSANNTIRNIEHYLHLNDRQKEVLTSERLGKKLSFNELFTIWKIYFKASTKFIRQEKAGLLDLLSIYWKLSTLDWYLVKYWIKH